MLNREGILEIATGQVKRPHPVVDVINRELPKIQKLIANGSEMHSMKASYFLSDHSGFLADAVEQIGTIPVEPEDLLVIGVRLYQFPPFPVHQTFVGNIALITCCAYAVEGIPDAVGKGFPRYYLEHHREREQYRLPEQLMSNRAGLLYAKARLEGINNSIQQLMSADHEPNQTKTTVVCDTATYFLSSYHSLKYGISMVLGEI